MQRVLVHVSAAVSLAILLLGSFSLAALAEANPNNRGHHYGQLKHHQAPPPATIQNPGSNNSVGAATGTIQLMLPALKLLPAARPAAQIKPVSTHRSQDPWWWLVVLLVPALLALWLLSVRRVALAATTTAKPQVAPQPA